MKPIIFNTDMVRAILDDRKTVTRRAIKPQPTWIKPFDGNKLYKDVRSGSYLVPVEIAGEVFDLVPKYQPGDILYVRETWAEWIGGRYAYKAHCFASEKYFDREGNEIHFKWRPSIHMPKAAARIFLRVTDVRVERLQSISDSECEKDGIVAWSKDGLHYKYAPADDEGDYPVWKWSDTPSTPQVAMQRIWNSAEKQENRRWAANPWVWVIEFERCEKPEVKTCV